MLMLQAIHGSAARKIQRTAQMARSLPLKLGLHGSLFNFCWWKVLMFRFWSLCFVLLGLFVPGFWASLGQENLTVSVAANGSEEVCGKALMNVTWLDDWSHIFILFWCFDCALIVFDWFWFVSLTSRLKALAKLHTAFWHGILANENLDHLRLRISWLWARRSPCQIWRSRWLSSTSWEDQCLEHAWVPLGCSLHIRCAQHLLIFVSLPS